MTRLKQDFGRDMRIAWARGPLSVKLGMEWHSESGTHSFPHAELQQQTLKGFFEGGEVDPTTIAGDLLAEAAGLAQWKNNQAIALTGKTLVLE